MCDSSTILSFLNYFKYIWIQKTSCCRQCLDRISITYPLVKIPFLMGRYNIMCVFVPVYFHSLTTSSISEFNWPQLSTVSEPNFYYSTHPPVTILHPSINHHTCVHCSIVSFLNYFDYMKIQMTPLVINVWTKFLLLTT